MYIKRFLKKPLVMLITLIAQAALKKHTPKIIAVTGSVGKTTTKDVLAAGLSDFFSTRTAQKSFNSDIGVPLSILGLDNPGISPYKWICALCAGARQVFSKKFPELLVLEVGAGAPGDIKNIATWLRPDISVFTRLAHVPVHIEFFESKEQLYEEKKSLALYTKPGGLVLYNGNDELLKDTLADITIKKDTFVPTGLVTFSREGTTMHSEYPVVLPGVLGFQIMYPVAALIKIYSYLSVDEGKGIASLEKNYTPTPGRARIIRGIDDLVLIDDAYNASPIAVEASLEVLKSFETDRRKIFVFGDMMELGNYGKKAHIDVALQADFVHELITVGTLSRDTHMRAVALGVASKHFETSKEAGRYLQRTHIPGDTILFKASRHAIKMEQAIVQLVLKEEQHKLVQEYL